MARNEIDTRLALDLSCLRNGEQNYYSTEAECLGHALVYLVDMNKSINPHWKGALFNAMDAPVRSVDMRLKACKVIALVAPTTRQIRTPRNWR